ncbi:acyltransferase domain-containing protein, partial [Streptomyces sp. NPDC059209]|uniref:acyltransferase domain-containing protein n=1 Tax=Streptomyces sp. NPDC059209 TaxID=3346769 RepID=UPI0036A5D654
MGLVRGEVVRGEVVFVFPGQGSQWLGMGLELAEEFPVFGERLRLCGEVLEPYVGWSLLDVLGGGVGVPSLERVDVVQPALFAVMVSLAGLWGSLGVVPSAVVGHSQGEIAAACVAGVLSLDDAARVVAVRSRVLGGLSGGGGMGVVSLGVGEVVGRLVGVWGGLSVAAVNGPASTVVAGEAGLVGGFLELLGGEGCQVRRVPVDYASHSVGVEGVRGELLGGLEGVVGCAGDVPFVSTVTGGVVDGAGLDGGYWFRNLRETVRFEDAVRGLLGGGHRLFVECSPHPSLLGSVVDTADEVGVRVAAVGSLRRGDGGRGRFVTSVA